MGLQYKCEQAQNHFTSKPEEAGITSIFNFSVTCFSRSQSSVHISKSVCATLHTITVHVHSRIWCQLHGATCLRKLGHMIKKKNLSFYSWNDELSTLFRRKKEFVFWQWHGKSDVPVFRLYLNAFTFVDMWNWHRKNCKHGVHEQRDSSISGDHFRHIRWFIGEWKNVTNILRHLHTQETLWPGKTPYMWWGRNKENMFVQVWIYL